MDASGEATREKAARRAEVRASIGRALRDLYEADKPFPDRLVELVRKIEQPTGEQVGDASSDLHEPRGLSPPVS
jgi:hypothetical protein